MSTIPHFAPGQLPLFPEVIQLRRQLAATQRFSWQQRQLARIRQESTLAHVSAILSPYQVEAMAERAIVRAWQGASTTEEADLVLDTWLEDVARTYLFDREC